MKKKRTDNSPESFDKETMGAVRRSDWMMEHVNKILFLGG